MSLSRPETDSSEKTHTPADHNTHHADTHNGDEKASAGSLDNSDHAAATGEKLVSVPDAKDKAKDAVGLFELFRYIHNIIYPLKNLSQSFLHV